MLNRARAALAKNKGSLTGFLVSSLQKFIRSDFVQKIAETFGTRVSLIILSIATSIIVTRTLGPEGRGLMMVALTIGAIGVQFGNFGIQSSNTYYISKDRKLLPVLFGNSVMFSFAAGFMIIIGIKIFLVIVPDSISIDGLLLKLSFAWIPLGLLFLFVQNLFLGIQEVRSFNISEIINSVINICLVIIVIVFRKVSVEIICLLGLVSMAVSLLWSIWILLKHMDRLPYISLKVLRDNFYYGFKGYASVLFAFIVLRVDLLMVEHFLGSAQTGYYSISTNLTEKIYLLPVVVGTILFPKLSAQFDEALRWELAKKTAFSVTIIMILCAAGMLIIAKPAIITLYGEEFSQAIPAVYWLLPGIVALSINVIFMNYFASMGMPLFCIYSPGIASLVNFVLNLKFIPAYGIVGASMTSSIAYSLMLLMSLCYIYFTNRKSIPQAA